MSDFFSDNEVIFYKSLSDLSYKLNKYKKDEKTGKKIAKMGKQKYFKYFNSNIVSDFIVNKTLELKFKKKVIW